MELVDSREKSKPALRQPLGVNGLGIAPDGAKRPESTVSLPTLIE